MKILIDIPDNLNKKLKIYKAKNDYVNLQKALINVLERFFKVKQQKQEVKK